jgi:hypothetical protein
MDRRMADYKLARFRRDHRRLSWRWLETEDELYPPSNCIEINCGFLKRQRLVLSNRLSVLAALFGLK